MGHKREGNHAETRCLLQQHPQLVKSSKDEASGRSLYLPYSISIFDEMKVLHSRRKYSYFDYTNAR